MLRSFLIAIAVLLAVSTPFASGQVGLITAMQAQKSGPATQPTAAADATQPTTQPAQASTHDGKDLGDIDLIRVIKGEKALTVEQIFQLGYWVDFGKDFLFGIFSLIPRLFAAVFLFGIFWVIYRFVRRVVVGGMAKAGVDASIRDMLSSLLKWSILGFGLVIAGNQIGIQIAALLTGVSIIGLAVGFAAQETLSNFIAGVVIFWDKPFKVGDWIEIDGVYAQVQRVTFRSTRLGAGNGDVVVMPNTTMLSTKLRNRTTNPMTQVKIEIGIAYKESIANARAVLLATTDGDARICPDPAPGVSVAACADSSVNLALAFWTAEEGLEGTLRSEYLEKAKDALDAAGISIPFPHVQLLVEQTPATTAALDAGLRAAA
jgi:small conductance mechanosensitive channel